MTIPEVWELCADDSCVSPDTYEPERSRERVWLGVYEGIAMIGMIYVHAQNSSTIQMHPYLLKGYKHKIRDVMKLFFAWAFAMPEIHKVNVTVPFIYQKLRNCCLKAGFKDEGVNRMSYRKNSEIVDQWHMGAVRGEV